MRRIGVILVAVRELRARRSVMSERAAKIASGSGARLELFHDLATPDYIDSLDGTGASVENLTRQAITRALQQLERWRPSSTSAARACSIIGLVASRTTRLGSICSPPAHLFNTLARCLAGKYLLHRDALVSGLDRTPPQRPFHRMPPAPNSQQL